MSGYGYGEALGGAALQQAAAETTEVRERRLRAEHLAACKRRRANYITYMRDRIEDEDWHGVSDAANDLRELDCEIRCLEAPTR